MVSIPDWSRLKHLFTEASASSTLTERYKKLREVDAIKKAELSGLFVKLDKKYIDKHLAEDVFTSGSSLLNKYDTPEKSYKGICLIYLTGRFIRSVKDLTICENLTVCVLSNNYITKINPLMQCRKLRKLDLHNNQITLLPSSHYWAELTSLQFLYLHGNPIAQLDNVHCMAGTESINVLTMYDTPLSLKRNYRHHVVNSVWTLKVLDKHVISDEEIIEDAHFGDIFAPLHPNFAIDVCPSLPPGVEPKIEDEEFCMRMILRQINFIQAHCSPVIILQRCMRGYLLRKRMGISPKKSVFLTSLRTDHGSPPVPTGTPLPVTDEDLNIMDYDNYLQAGKRPISQPTSEFSLGSYRQLTSELDGHRAPVSSATIMPGNRRVFVNFSKLEHETLKNLTDEQTMTNKLMENKVTLSAREDTFLASWKKKKHKTATETEEGEVLPLVNFRLTGLKTQLQVTDQYISELKLRKQAAQMVKDADIQHHIEKEQEELPYIPYQPPKNTFKRNMKTVQTTMNMAPLWAVHRAYKERDKAEKATVRSMTVNDSKEQRDTAKHRINLYQEDKRQRAIHDREHDQKVAMEILEKREQARSQFLERNQALREKRSQQSKRRVSEKTFIHDFSTQNTSVSNALLRHDRLARREDTKLGQNSVVHNMRENAIEHSDVVKKYLEHRQLLRQTEAAMTRAAIDTRMLQEANERLMEAKARVAQQKARSATVEQFYPLPENKTQLLPPMDPNRVSGMQGLNRYYTSILMSSGHVGKHPALFTY